MSHVVPIMVPGMYSLTKERFNRRSRFEDTCWGNMFYNRLCELQEASLMHPEVYIDYVNEQTPFSVLVENSLINLMI